MGLELGLEVSGLGSQKSGVGIRVRYLGVKYPKEIATFGETVFEGGSEGSDGILIGREKNENIDGYFISC